MALSAHQSRVGLRANSSSICSRRALVVRATATMEAKTTRNGVGVENYISEVPETLTRPDLDTPDTMRFRFEKMIREAQDSICAAIEEIDGTKFRQDAWVRNEGGGGITRVIQDGNVWEKAGVNVSVVYGSMPAEAYRAASSNPELMAKIKAAGNSRGAVRRR
ncbi:coproporphyrinogen III oxidase [Monoraphidium neglectum]|uniref:coproporphyrinogen oxidase n=1 Tax=Monoraphidium neglectum TaxID=145388 RepID=A0A0D2LWT5_9CHLO|nr:coproporphyrinogen III oxidase [Monoraphidium neglectum]KIY95939.1 coproporphyrinogen III oxidase [Monoraphidium neglectum]|eukprot:XP_013894959.1 coproporphyrinogen III oxidase [Monoraphidium neglectum]